MSEYRITVDAGNDLTDIRDYILKDNPPRAISFVDEIIARFDTIAERPTSFPALTDAPREIRSALHGRYRILFELIEGMPHILRILHGARDIPRLMEDE